MIPPIAAARGPRTPHARAAAAPTGAAATPPPLDDTQAAQERAIAMQRHAFDAQVEEEAELEREREAMEQLMLAYLKDEDEIVKKYIAMI